MTNGNWLGVLAVLVGFVGPVQAADIGTAIFYQGNLENGSGPVSDICDFRLGLWDAAVGGNQAGVSPVTVFDVAVAGGIFELAVDFGDAAFAREARWLRVEVRCTGDVSFTLLAPRVELRPVPYAIGLRHLSVEPAGPDADTYEAPNVIGGFAGNHVQSDGVVGATVFGGGAFNSIAYPNYATKRFTTISGGLGNQAGGAFPSVLGTFSTIGGGAFNNTKGNLSTIGGGSDNETGDDYSTVAGGGANNAAASFSTIGGGTANFAGGSYSTVCGGRSSIATGLSASIGGGQFNAASGDSSTVAGGWGNRAGGAYSFAAGRKAVVRDQAAAGDSEGDEGTFVWADDGPGQTGADFSSTGPNQFLIRATGGVRLATADGSTPQFQAIVPSTDTPEDLAINSLGGNVGIGTNAPSARLHIASPVSGSILALDGSGSTLESFVYTMPGGATGSAAILIGSPGGTPGVSGFAENGNRRDIRLTDGSLSLLTSSTSSTPANGNGIIIKELGAVGIGTDNPASELHVHSPDASSEVRITPSAPNQSSQILLSENTSGSFGTVLRHDGTADIFRIRALVNDVESGDHLTIARDTGRVGVGRVSTANALEVEGNASKTASGSWLANSDRRIKTDVRTIGNALEAIDRLRPVAFRYTDEYMSRHPSVKDQDYYNYIAQEFQEVFPDSVQSSGEDGILQVDSHPAGVYAVAAIQELHEIVRLKDDEITELKSQNSDFHCEIVNLKSQISEFEKLTARLARLEALIHSSLTEGDRP